MTRGPTALDLGLDPIPGPITSSALDTANGIIHGFFGRQGGVSNGLYASLNCGTGSDDRPEDVAENRTRIMSALALPRNSLRTLCQVHGNSVERVEDSRSNGLRPEADGMVTAIPGIALGILTADCVPVLFAEPIAGVIGAAHAGWKGALAGITDALIDNMVLLGARRQNIIAAVGPAIAANCYEVGPKFPAPFLAAGIGAEPFFRPSARPGHYLFDLVGYVVEQLNRAHIEVAECLNVDTYGNSDSFFSYRRSTHNGDPDYGRQLSVIAIPG